MTDERSEHGLKNWQLVSPETIPTCICGWDPTAGDPWVNAQQARNVIRHLHIAEDMGLPLPPPETAGDDACDTLINHGTEVRLASAHSVVNVGETYSWGQGSRYRSPSLAARIRAKLGGMR